MEMNYFETIIMTTIDALCCLILSTKLLDKKLFTFKRLIHLIFLATTSSILSFLLHNEISVILIGIITIASFIIFYNIDIDSTIYVYVITVVIILTVQFILLIPTKLIFGAIEYIFEIGIYPQIITLIIIIIISNIVPINLLHDYIVAENKIFKLILLNIFLLLFFGVFYWYVDINGVLENLISVLIISLILVYINFVILENGLRNKHEQEQLKIYEKYMLIIDEIISELRRKQHEYDNHIQALSMIPVTYGESAVVKEKIESYYSDIKAKNELVDFLKLENKILAGFLYAKYKQAKNNNIDLIVNIKNYFLDTEVKDYELIEMLGILIDNAIESTKNGKVYVKIDKKDDMNIIEVKNMHPYISQEQINSFFKKGMSTKGNGYRGYGLYNLTQLMKKYMGDIIVLNQNELGNNYVVFKIILKI